MAISPIMPEISLVAVGMVTVTVISPFYAICYFSIVAVIPVGLDIGSGFTKAYGNGRSVAFPSLVARTCRGGVMRMSDMDIVSDGDGGGMIEAVGREAMRIGRSRNSILVRPAQRGRPYDRRGYALLAAHALKEIGVEPKDAVICAGMAHEAKDQKEPVRRILNGLNPRVCIVIPQAVGTLASCGRTYGMVINIGHGATEIVNIRAGSVDSVSIEKAAGYVISQISPRTDKGAYVDHVDLLAANSAAVERLVPALASHIADGAVRVGGAGYIVLAGGGSLIPGMGLALEIALGSKITTVEDPVMSNAAGFEAKASDLVARLGGWKSPE